MENKYELLIVEDRVDEAIYAQRDAFVNGFRDMRIASNLEDALNLMQLGPKYIVSDLFYSLGNLEKEVYVSRLLPIYEDYESKYKRLIENKEDNVLYKVIHQMAEVFDVSPEKYVREIIPSMDGGGDSLMTKLTVPCMDILKGVENYFRWEKYQKVKDDIISGENMPCGIFLVEEAKKRDIPIQIVTSTNHHDSAFEPISRLINTKYHDYLVDGRKNWDAAYKSIRGE